jgi:hypothetical protein
VAAPAGERADDPDSVAVGILRVDVDVVPAETLKPRIRAEVLAEAIPL